MLRFAHRTLIVTSAALAGFISTAFLPMASPAAAASAGYCHAQYRVCVKRFSARTCDGRYDRCMAYSASTPGTAIVIGGFPRLHRPKGGPKGGPKTDPKTPPTPPKTGGGPVGNPLPKPPTTGTNAPAGGVKGPGGVVIGTGTWSSGGGKGGGGKGGGVGGPQPSQNLIGGGGRSGVRR